MFVTHDHGDHSLAIEEFEDIGIKVVKPYESKTLNQGFKCGGFTIFSFAVPHDGEPCVGYIVYHEDMGTLIYMTDLEFSPYTFQKYKPEHLLVEANYSKDMVDMQKNNREHVLKGHCELGTTIGIIKANMTDSLQNIVLCHLSKFNAEPKQFLAEVQKIAKCDTYIAEKGLEIELNRADKCPFM